MKNDNIYLSIGVAVLIGMAQLFLLNYCWAFINVHSPLPNYLLEAGFHGTSFYLLLLCLGFLVNVALCLPAAYALCRLRPSKIFLYLAFAIVPGFIWEYRLVFTNPASFENWTLFLPGALSSIAMLPIAVLVIYYATIKKRLTTQSS